MKVTAADLMRLPQSQCGCTEQQCPLMRLCPVCDQPFDSARRRRAHQNRCRGAIDVPTVEAQHVHLIEVHRVRRRRDGQAWG